jgi:ketosteroid isomerase-like protein
MADRAKKMSGDAVQSILEIQHRWVEALVQADTAALDAILVDPYVDTDESGCRLDKAGVLAALKSGDLKLTSITLLQTDVHRYGNSAVLTGTSAQTGAFQGQPIAPKILFTATMVLQNGHWRAVAAHRTAVPDH